MIYPVDSAIHLLNTELGPGWYAFSTTGQAVVESGTLQEDEAKRGYPNLFKLIDSAIEFNSATVAYIGVLLKDIMLLTLLSI